jgi:nucleotidyltransferase/DNA polymerase involved in DNA repair
MGSFPHTQAKKAVPVHRHKHIYAHTHMLAYARARTHPRVLIHRRQPAGGD